jgi:hypothetical protein
LIVSVGGDRGFGRAAQAAHRFLRSLGSTSAESVLRRPKRPSVPTITHMQVLQALDGDATGASQREIGRRLFGKSAESNWAADSPWRSRVRYLIRCGRERSRCGYRRMAGLGVAELREEAASGPPSLAPLPTGACKNDLHSIGWNAAATRTHG